MKDEMYIEVSKLTSRIEAIEKQVIDSQHLRHNEGNHVCDENNCSVVITNVAETTGENIDSKINNLLVGGLKINDIKSVNCQRLPSRQRGKPSVVKVRFRNVSDKVAVLKSKQQLKNTTEYSRVYIRDAKVHAERLIEINFDTMIKELKLDHEYRVSGNGRLLAKADDG